MLSQLSTTNRQEVSWNGYRADVLKSAIQKYIRRGVTEKALYCAGELDLFKEAADKSAGEVIRTNFLHRLMIIYMEDVENRSILEDIDRKMKELFTERTLPARSKEKEERLISEVVVEMGQSTKARVCSHIRAVFNAKYKDIQHHYPEVSALWNEIEQNEKRRVEVGTELFPFLCESFTTYLKQKNILAVYYGFHIEGSTEKLKEAFKGSKKPVWYIFKELSAHSEDKLGVNIMIQWYKEHIGTLNEGFMCWLYPLLLELGAITKGQKPVIRFEDYPLNWDANRSNQRIEIDDVVLDKHTAKGRGKGVAEFALNEALVENPAPFVNPMWKQFYEDGKRLEEKIPILGPSAPSAPSAASTAPIKIKKPTMKKEPVAAPVAALEEEKEERKLEPQEKVKEVAPVIKEAIKPEISISIMNDNFVFIDNLYRSRITLLDILAERGYDVEKYRKFSPAEATAAASSLAGLSFIVAKKDNAEHICDVRYITNSRPKMDVFFNDVPDEKSETTEVVVMMEGTVAEIHHQAALKQYMKWKEPNEAGEKTRRKLRVSFFSIYTIVINPMRHVLVPKHEIIHDVEDAHKKLMDSMYITAKSKFPEIKFHTDPIARCIGAVPGDIVKITRPSASSGQAIIYRVCAP
jgi:DNA-directed RNA polymerase subunit H